MNVNYNYFEKVLHHLSLGNKIIRNTMFQLEVFFFKNKNHISEKNHVFICGLPRSGTTVILEAIHKSNNFASLTYRDMPFILSPNINRILFKYSNTKSIIRSHNDGIFYNIDSPEALDEVFFKTYDTDELEKYLLIYISLVLKKYKKEKYLSKNNNILEKIDIIKKVLKNPIFLLPFRDPLQHSNSLLLQHKNFTNLQNNNQFIVDYMDYLGHNEFGKNHVSWNKSKLFHDFEDINYWLEQWFLYYENILKNYANKKNLFLISYNDICASKQKFIKLLNENNIEIDQNYDFKKSERKINFAYKKELLKDCLDLFANLNSKFNSYTT